MECCVRIDGKNDVSMELVVILTYVFSQGYLSNFPYFTALIVPVVDFVFYVVGYL